MILYYLRFVCGSPNKQQLVCIKSVARDHKRQIKSFTRIAWDHVWNNGTGYSPAAFYIPVNDHMQWRRSQMPHQIPLVCELNNVLRVNA